MKARYKIIDERYTFPAEHDIDKIDLDIAISKLPIHLRRIHYLYYEMGYTLEEVGGIIGMTKQSVSEHLERIQKKIKKYLTNDPSSLLIR